MMYRNVLITQWDLNDTEWKKHKKELRNKTPELSDSIDEFYKEELESKGIEVFEKCDNILITEDGFYGAFYDDDLVG